MTTEASANAIKIEISVSLDMDEPQHAYAMGHHDRAAFIEALHVQSEYVLGCAVTIGEGTRVRHEYWRFLPPDDNGFIQIETSDVPADDFVPVTCVDCEDIAEEY